MAYSASSANAERDLEYDLGLLEVQVVAGDRQAVRLAFRLRPKADGHAAETIDIMLGRLVRVNPSLLLEELQREHGKAPSRSARGCDVNLANYGYVYVDRMSAQAYETERRIAALKTVTNEDLQQVRDGCVEDLQKRLPKRPEP